MAARFIQLSALRGTNTHVVLTAKRLVIGYGSHRDCDDYAARKANQQANPGCFVQELAPLPVRKVIATVVAAKEVAQPVEHKAAPKPIQQFVIRSKSGNTSKPMPKDKAFEKLLKLSKKYGYGVWVTRA